MKASTVQAQDGVIALIQGFRGSEGHGIQPYVYMDFRDEETGDDPTMVEFTPENAHILSEEIRKHAEFASAGEEK